MNGYSGALAEASAVGCPAIQMLPYRRHYPPTPADLESFRKSREASAVRRLVIHSRFVPSLGTSDPERRARSVELLAKELEYASGLGGESFILHAGAYSPGSTLTEGLRLVAESIGRAYEKAGVRLPILIENVPGGGRRMGGTLEEIQTLFSLLREKISAAGVCLDTAHAWAAGYDLSNAKAMLKFLSRVNRILGAENIKVFHLNDTRALLGSHLEHHWHWGRGFIGAEGLKTLLERPEYADAVGIIENPKTAGADKQNYDFVTGTLGG